MPTQSIEGKHTTAKGNLEELESDLSWRIGFVNDYGLHFDELWNTNTLDMKDIERSKGFFHYNPLTFEKSARFDLSLIGDYKTLSWDQIKALVKKKIVLEDSGKDENYTGSLENNLRLYWGDTALFIPKDYENGIYVVDYVLRHSDKHVVITNALRKRTTPQERRDLSADRLEEKITTLRLDDFRSRILIRPYDRDKHTHMPLDKCYENLMENGELLLK